MTLKTRLIIAASICLLIGILGAYELTQGIYLIPGIVAAVFVWILIEWRNRALPEAWCMAAALFGYIVGNRGFAQLVLIPGFPLLPAEGALGVAGVGLLVRGLIHKQSLLQKDPLNLTLVLWMGYATARLPFDVRAFGVYALRDYAMAYYAGFFFLGQVLSRHPASRRLIKHAITLAFAILPPTVAANKLFPGFFLTTFTWNGIPLIFEKDDLIAGSLVCGALWFWTLYELDGRKLWLVPSELCFLLVAATASPRAAIVGGAIVTSAWLLARRNRIIGFLLGSAAVAVAISIPLEIALDTPLEQTKAYGMYERTRSIVDWTGNHTYESADAASTGDNNQFRLVWWNAVYQETMEKSPVFGLGFGYDLSTRFLADYNWLESEADFTTRSPHSFILTNFGRLGAIGLTLLLAVAAAAVTSAKRSFQQKDLEAMGWWSVAGVLGVSACFGVVLESPMGAVIFWICLGIAHATAEERAKKPTEETDPALPKAEETVSLEA